VCFLNGVVHCWYSSAVNRDSSRNQSILIGNVVCHPSFVSAAPGCCHRYPALCPESVLALRSLGDEVVDAKKDLIDTSIRSREEREDFGIVDH